MDSSTLYVFINFIFYVVICFVTYKKSDYKLTGGLFLFILFGFSALCSFLFHTHPLTALSEFDYKHNWEAFVYYAIINVLMITPLVEFEKNRTPQVKPIDENDIITILKILLLLQIIAYIIITPVVFYNLTHDIGDIRNASYEGELSSARKNLSWVASMFQQTYMSFRNITFIISLYAFFFIKKNKKIVVSSLVLSALYPIYSSVFYVMRSYILFQIYYLVFFFILFRNQIQPKLRKKIIIYSLIPLGLIVSFMIMVSNSRFDSMASWFYYRYSGEMFLNFSGELWPNLQGSTYGSAYFTWFLNEHNWNDLIGKWEYIHNITKIDPHIFYGYVGGLSIEFGFILTFFIILFLAIFIRMSLNKTYISLSKMLIIGYFAHILIDGTAVFSVQGWGNLELLLFILGYIYIKKKEKKYLLTYKTY